MKVTQSAFIYESMFEENIAIAGAAIQVLSCNLLDIKDSTFKNNYGRVGGAV